MASLRRGGARGAALHSLIAAFAVLTLAGCSATSRTSERQAAPSGHYEASGEEGESAEEKKREAAELSKNRELLSLLEAKKREEQLEGEAKHKEALANARLKRREAAAAKRAAARERAIKKQEQELKARIERERRAAAQKQTTTAKQQTTSKESEMNHVKGSSKGAGTAPPPQVHTESGSGG